MKNLKMFSSEDIAFLTGKSNEDVLREIRFEKEVLGYYKDLLQEYTCLDKEKNLISIVLFTKKGASYFLKKYNLLKELKTIETLDDRLIKVLNDFYEDRIKYDVQVHTINRLKDKSMKKKKEPINYYKKFFTITEICEPFDIGASKTNKLLEELGIIHKYKEEWVLSPGYHRLGRNLNTGYYHNQMINYGKNKLRFNIGGLKYIRNILKTHGIKLKADK